MKNTEVCIESVSHSVASLPLWGVADGQTQPSSLIPSLEIPILQSFPHSPLTFAGSVGEYSAIMIICGAN